MILRIPEYFYGVGARLFHRHWDKQGGWKAPVPVISVGNITVGGTGKTPFVVALARLLSEQFPDLAEQNRIAVLSRGYGRKSSELVTVTESSDWRDSGDEPLLIKRSCPSSLVISFAKRVESARIAVESFGAKLIILDDGFQHRALARNIDLVILDAADPLGNGRLLPAGRLREPVSALARASMIVVNGEGSQAKQLADRFGKTVIQVASVPLSETWSAEVSQPAFLITGIARPERVRQSLDEAGIRLVGHRAFRDHHAFSVREFSDVQIEAQKRGAKSILMTSKDMARIFPIHGGLPVTEIPHELKIVSAQELIANVLQQRCMPAASHSGTIS